jgi:hypothetical protein
MGQLNGDRHVGPASHALERPAYRGFRFIVPQADVGMADPSLGHYGRCLDGQQGRARKREVPEMDEMPVGHAPFYGRVLAHGRDDNAVRKFEAADLQRCEQHAHG